MKNNSILKVALCSLVAIFVACSSVESDAKKAAKLSKESERYVLTMEFDKAEQAFKKAQKLFRKYEQKGEAKAFATAYECHLRPSDE